MMHGQSVNATGTVCSIRIPLQIITEIMYTIFLKMLSELSVNNVQI